ncbi:uncharacterized protein LOC143624266 [Bidens hawaiensis]|uniref:uncharacterized protein LOC143624266 n=1 Tax=Bidens hawaiensis TaxID=980011 RepID=UPI00404B4AB7
MVDHRISIPYHPQTSGKIEVSNRQIKHIFTKNSLNGPQGWSLNLVDALWAYRKAYKTAIGTIPYILVCGNDCHLPVELAQRAYWATKQVNTSYDDAYTARKLAFGEIEEVKAYGCAYTYKANMNKVHDAKIRLKNFELGQRVWLYNTRMKLFPGKLKSIWAGPYPIVGIGNHGQYEIEYFDYHVRKLVNNYMLNPYSDMEDIHKLGKESVSTIVTSPVYEDN